MARVRALKVLYLDAGYRDLEQQYNDLDWLLVDSGSSIHVCRDKHKLYNMRRHTTRIRGIVGDAVAVCYRYHYDPLCTHVCIGCQFCCSVIATTQ